MNAYDYEEQKWVDGKEGDKLALRQTKEELEMIENNPEYLVCIGITPEHKESYIATLTAQAERLQAII